MALKDYTSEERGTIERFLGDKELWRELGRTSPVKSFADIEKQAKEQKNRDAAIKKRMEQELEFIGTCADEAGRIGGRLSLLVRQNLRQLVNVSNSVYDNEQDFQRYMELLKAVCRVMKKW